MFWYQQISNSSFHFQDIAILLFRNMKRKGGGIGIWIGIGYQIETHNLWYNSMDCIKSFLCHYPTRCFGITGAFKIVDLAKIADNQLKHLIDHFLKWIITFGGNCHFLGVGDHFLVINDITFWDQLSCMCLCTANPYKKLSICESETLPSSFFGNARILKVPVIPRHP